MEQMMGKLNFLVVVKWAAAMGLSAIIASSLTGCAVFAVADAAVSVAATAVKVTAKTVGVAADIVLPSSDKKVEKDKDGAKK
jgi:hypothetical protein